MKPACVAVLLLALLVAACGGSSTPNVDSQTTGAPQTSSELTTPNSSAADPGAAVLRLVIDNCRGLTHQRATAVRVGEHMALTVAHSFLVDDQVSVATLEVFDRSGAGLTAEVVYLDPAIDVAILRLDEPGEGLELSVYDGDQSARLASFSASHDQPEVREIEIGQAVDATLDGDGARRALELIGEVHTGESGAPVLDDDGRVIGIVFASSKTQLTGWAISAEEFAAALTEPANPIGLGCGDQG